MTQPKYPEIFEQLQNTIAKLDTESANLTDAVLEYARGIELKKTCTQQLDRLEQSISTPFQPTAIDQSTTLEAVFAQLEQLESEAYNLPDNHLEALLTIVERAESLVQHGEQHINILQSSLSSSGATDV